jgi:hypothetical protein
MTNVRDKMIIIAVTMIALGDMALMAFRGFDGTTIIRDVILLFGTAFGGRPTPPEATPESKGKDASGSQ